MSALFSEDYFSMKKGAGGPKFLDLTQQIFLFFHSDLESAGTINPHSSYIQKPPTIRVNAVLAFIKNIQF